MHIQYIMIPSTSSRLSIAGWLISGCHVNTRLLRYRDSQLAARARFDSVLPGCGKNETMQMASTGVCRVMRRHPPSIGFCIGELHRDMPTQYQYWHFLWKLQKELWQRSDRKEGWEEVEGIYGLWKGDSMFRVFYTGPSRRLRATRDKACHLGAWTVPTWYTESSRYMYLSVLVKAIEE